MRPSPILLINVIAFTLVWVIPDILAPINLNYVVVRVFAPHYLGNGISPTDILAIANVVMFVSTVGTVVPPFNAAHS